MFYTEKFASETIHIPLEDRRQCEDMMDRVYREAPDKWPYGLKMSSFDGGVYMVREASSGRPVGFTGWQEQRGHDGKKVGYYSIGILPEYRMNGYAKAAVASLLQEKAAGVDRVEAFIVPGNKPSIALADSLGVSVVHGVFSKKASIKRILGSDALKNVAVGTLSAGGMDVLTHGGGQTPTEYVEGLKHMDVNRMLNMLLNATLGGIGRSYAGQARHATSPEKSRELSNMAKTMFLSMPTKDLTITGIGELPKAVSALEGISKGLNTPPKAGMSNRAKLVLALTGLATAGGAGLLMHRRNKATEELAQATREAGRGKVRLTLPTDDPYDVETQVEVPLDQVPITESIQQDIARDTRRRLRGESDSRIMRRGEGDEVMSENMDSFSDGTYPYNSKMAAAKQASSREDLVSAGSCCGSGCEECPYLPKHQEGATKLGKK